MKKKSEFITGCVITPPCGRATIHPLSNLLRICNELFGKTKLVLIYGDQGDDFNHIIENELKVEVYLINYKREINILTRVFNYFIAQFKALYYIIIHSKSVSVYFFYLADTLILPMIVTKLLRKKTIIIIGANVKKEMDVKKDFFINIFKLFININYKLADRIILYSPNLVKNWKLESYKDKIAIAHEHFLDTNNFKIYDNYNDRNNLIGYIGRLSEEKGTLNFVKAIPEILKQKSDFEFLIVGDGPLRDQIEEFVNRNNLNKRVKLTGWISHEELPSYMNKLKLAVLPSYSEGLPNIMLELMECGTPVLATPVGAIPDLIKDGKTGFIMENNSPECISKNVIRVLKCRNLEHIVFNATTMVKNEFTFMSTVKNFKLILGSTPIRPHDRCKTDKLVNND